MIFPDVPGLRDIFKCNEYKTGKQDYFKGAVASRYREQKM